MFNRNNYSLLKQIPYDQKENFEKTYKVANNSITLDQITKNVNSAQLTLDSLKTKKDVISSMKTDNKQHEDVKQRNLTTLDNSIKMLTAQIADYETVLKQNSKDVQVYFTELAKKPATKENTQIKIYLKKFT